MNQFTDSRQITKNVKKYEEIVRKQIRYRQKWQVELQSRTGEQNVAPKGRKIGGNSPGLNQHMSEPTTWRGGRGRGFSPEDRG